MKKFLISSFMVVLIAAQLIFAHDPRTTAKEFSHSIAIEGAGKLTMRYKSLHWNERGYTAAKGNEQLRTRLNGSLWKKVGKFDTEFDVVIGGVTVPKGSYDMGVNFGANDDFKLVLGSEGKDLEIPLQTTKDIPIVNYLSFDLRPNNDTDTFVLEGRLGTFSAWAETKVPYLSEHDHKDK